MSAVTGAQDRRFMAEALALAEEARGRSAPNPNVGCVIVSPADKVVGRGATAAGEKEKQRQFQKLEKQLGM